MREDAGGDGAGVGLVDEVADDGATVDRALEMARTVASLPPTTVRIVKEAANAAAGSLNAATSFADADQSQLCATSGDAVAARAAFAAG